MGFFNIGIYAGGLSFILWVLFDQKFLNHIGWLKDANHWLKSSYRRSLILDLAIIIGFFGIQTRLLDLVNSLTAVLITGSFTIIYNSVIVSKNKVLNRNKQYKKQETNIFSFLGVLIAAIGVTSIFFSFATYGANMLTFLLYALPLTGMIVITFKAWRRIRR